MDDVRNFSYTRCAKDEDCRRARYYSREFGGTGIVPVQSGWNIIYGNIIHKALESLAKTGTVDYKSIKAEVEATGSEIYNLATIRDWAALAEGQVRGFVRCVWPNLLAEYEIFDTERWIVWDVEPGYRFRARQDLLLKNKFDGHLCYVDYKTSSSYKPQWVASWAKSPQLHSSMYALKMAEGVQVQRAIVIGLYKGYQDEKNGIQRSIFTYSYCNREYSMIPEYAYEYKRAKGWEMFSIGEEFEDQEQWIANMPLEKLTEQYPQTGPIFARDDIAEKYFRQQLIREKEVDEAIKRLHESTSVEEITRILDTHFKQNFSKCEPAYGYKCEYANLCWQPWVEADPLGSGLYKQYEEIAVDE